VGRAAAGSMLEHYQEAEEHTRLAEGLHCWADMRKLLGRRETVGHIRGVFRLG
jgi:hypothetical protein